MGKKVMVVDDSKFMYEASAEILKVHPDAKIIVVSSLAYDDTMTRATEIGAKGFLFKPIEKALLLEALSKVFEEENA